MSLADPNSVTISAITTPLPRTSTEEDKSEYTSADGLIQLIASHDYGKRVRHLIRLDTSKITADPYKPAENVRVGMSVYTVFDMPVPGAGYTNAEALAAWVGFNTLLTASSNVAITKLLGGES